MNSKSTHKNSKDNNQNGMWQLSFDDINSRFIDNTTLKEMRKSIMDKVSLLVNYAYDNGSRNSALYYISFSKLLQKYSVNYRKINIISKIIHKGIEYKVDYHKIYKSCRNAIKN